jgi:hypothetical protein
MGHLNPKDLTAKAYDEVKVLLKEFIISKDKPPTSPEQIMLAKLQQIIAKEQAQMSLSEKLQFDKRAQAAGPSDDQTMVQNPFRLQGMHFQSTKKV